MSVRNVGPRIIRYGFVGGQNLFKEFPDQLCRPAQNATKSDAALIFYPRHFHAAIFRVRCSEAPFSGVEFMHMAVKPTHCGLQHIVQLC